ncbi:hypothetical protein KIPB_006955 [Kipferlia bialata]|uniref:Uncharacterized protein n=1 Tax=Kipferlia bialata TaxID=797122 RepID=A0A391NWX1_9EUKA|nr:hypothetical protein KIPB_006955 [Kipferlia bialata]|eukprot:g6955.t1
MSTLPRVATEAECLCPVKRELDYAGALLEQSRIDTSLSNPSRGALCLEMRTVSTHLESMLGWTCNVSDENYRNINDTLKELWSEIHRDVAPRGAGSLSMHRSHTLATIHHTPGQAPSQAEPRAEQDSVECVTSAIPDMPSHPPRPSHPSAPASASASASASMRRAASAVHLSQRKRESPRGQRGRESSGKVVHWK